MPSLTAMGASQSLVPRAVHRAHLHLPASIENNQAAAHFIDELVS